MNKTVTRKKFGLAGTVVESQICSKSEESDFYSAEQAARKI